VAVPLDKIDAIMRHKVAPDHRRERGRVSQSPTPGPGAALPMMANM
jgi:hypothetical protein